MSPHKRTRRASRGAATQPRLELSRRFLYDLFAPQQQLGSAWSDDHPAFLLVEGSYGRFRLALYARPGGGEHWELRVVASPPPRSATAELRFSTRSFRAPFDENGTAVVRDVPASLLTSIDGPPLKINITRRGT